MYRGSVGGFPTIDSTTTVPALRAGILGVAWREPTLLTVTEANTNVVGLTAEVDPLRPDDIQADDSWAIFDAPNGQEGDLILR